jgi:predicted nucleotidyltransferase
MYFVHFESQNATLKSLKQDILRAIAYFDIFSYPLKKEEIWQFLQQCCEKYDFAQALEQMVSDGMISYSQGFYSLSDCNSLVQRRLKGNAIAAAQMPGAKRIARFLSGFPYVRAVGISGSLSKDFADENSDIDFFVITASDRLWIGRTLMHLFKKLTFLAGKQHWFCMNYYVDEIGLQIKEKNIFTAIETATVLPFQGSEAFREFFLANSWVNALFPNHVSNLENSRQVSNNLLKRFVEKILNNRIGDWLDKSLMRLTCKRWKKKANTFKLNNRGIIMGLDAGRHYAKPDPNNFQVKVVEQYEKKMQELMLKILASVKEPNHIKVSFLKK